MLRIRIITLFPEMILETVRHGLLGQALKKNRLEVSVINPRDFSSDKHRSVDDRPFGGGDGMVLLSEPLQQAIERSQAELEVIDESSAAHVVYLSPQGRPLTNEKARELSQQKNLIFICGRYGGIDQRIINHFVDEEISIGDYVLSGGEMAALVVTEALSRFIPGVLGHEESAEKDSFAEGLLEHPHFTRPREYLGAEVPEALLSGNHAVMEDWKKKVSLLVTYKKRPDLYLRYIKFNAESLASPTSTKKKRKDLVTELKDFYTSLTTQEKAALNLENINPEDLNV